MLNTLQYYYFLILIISLSIFWKYIYLATYISKYLFLHFSFTISYTLTTPLHITHHNSSKAPLLYSFTLKFYCFAAHKHISILFYTYFTPPISKYLNTSPYFSLTKSFLLENNLYNFFSNYNIIFLLSLITISLILSYITHITNTTSHKTSMSLPSPHFSRDAKHSYKSPSHRRHELLLQHSSHRRHQDLISKPFSYKAQLFLTKALLLEGTITSYIKLFS